MHGMRWAVLALAAVVGSLLAGCSDIGEQVEPNAWVGGEETGVTLGSLELYYDFNRGEGAAAFHPNAEAGSLATISGIGVGAWFGKTVYDKRTNIPMLGGANTGPVAVLGLGIYSTGNYTVLGPVYRVRTNHTQNQLYATYQGGKIGQNVTVLDPDDGMSNAVAVGMANEHEFLIANDDVQGGTADHGWSQTFEESAGAEPADELWTIVDPTDGKVDYRFGQIASGWNARQWAPCFDADGNAATLGRTTAADATPPNAVTLALMFKLPLSPSNQIPDGIYIKGDLVADIVFDSHSLGPDASWTPTPATTVDVEALFDGEAGTGAPAGAVGVHVDRDATGRGYHQYVNAGAMNVGRANADLTVTPGDRDLIPGGGVATTRACGLDVVDEFGKFYAASGVAGTGLVNVYVIPAPGADATAVGTVDVAMEQGFAAGDMITDIAVDPINRMLYVGWGGNAADNGRVAGYQLNADGTLMDVTADATSAVGVFNAAGANNPGGKLAVHPTLGSVYVSSGTFAAGANGVARLTATTLGSDGNYDLPGGANETYATVAVDPNGSLYVSVTSAHVAYQNPNANSPDEPGDNGLYTLAGPALPVAAPGIVRFDAGGTWTGATNLWGDDLTAGAPNPGPIFAGLSASGLANAAPTDMAYWGPGIVTGTSKLLFMDDYGPANGCNVAWGSM